MALTLMFEATVSTHPFGKTWCVIFYGSSMFRLSIFDNLDQGLLQGYGRLINVADSQSWELISDSSLPCPVCDLLEVAGAATASAKCYRQKLAFLFRSNPTLLLFALIRFRVCQGEAATSSRQLLDWCSSCLLAQFSTAIRDDSSEGSRWAANDLGFWNSFLAQGDEVNRGNCESKQLRRVLDCWLKAHVALNKAERKSLLKAVISKRFKVSHFRVRMVKDELLNTLVDQWENRGSGVSLEAIQNVFHLGVEYKTSQEEQDEKLHQAKMDAMRQLAYGASHEINNPLANIAGRAQALMVTEKDLDRKYRLAKIYQQSMRAHEMISDMMLFANPPEIQKSNVSIRLMLRRLIEKWEARKQETQCSLRVLVGTGVDRCPLDENLISVAIDCLLKNSIEALSVRSGARKEVELMVQLERGQLLISVIDEGPGVSLSDRLHLFDPFYSGREAGRGLGFGLSKVWRIAQLHGGVVYLDDEHTPGAKFVISLPVSLPDQKKTDWDTLSTDGPKQGIETSFSKDQPIRFEEEHQRKRA